MRSTIFIVDDSIIGYMHQENEDSIMFLESDIAILAVLFDGVSSSIEPNKTIEFCKQYIRGSFNKLSEGNKFSFTDTMYSLNKNIISGGFKGLTTYCGIYIDKITSTCSVSNIGDSRVYGIGKDYSPQEKLSIDHSLSEGSNIITKAMGLKLDYDDFYENIINTKPFLGLLLCSDGFYHLLDKNYESFYNVLDLNNKVKIKAKLKKMIIENNSDDASYIYIRFN